MSADPGDDGEPVDFRSGQGGRKVVFIAGGVVIAIAVVLAVLADRKPPRPEVNSDNKEGGGCPCGCDRSKQMVTELRAQQRAQALAAVEESLATIRAREETGYVTAAQIDHRLNLLDFEDELRRQSGDRPAPRAIDVGAWDANGGSWQTAGDASLRMSAELVVHGEMTEVVHGREKLQPAHFVIRLVVTNASSEDLKLTQPTLRADVGMPVRRWYLVGSDGQSWDGSLPKGEARRVHAIGYLSRAIAPGARVNATIHLGSLEISTSVRARERWNDRG